MRILITGCSTGFGRATSIEATRRGHEVVATARDITTLTDLDVAVASYVGEPIEVPIADHGIGLKVIRDAMVEYRLLGWKVEFHDVQAQWPLYQSNTADEAAAAAKEAAAAQAAQAAKPGKSK